MRRVAEGCEVVREAVDLAVVFVFPLKTGRTVYLSEQNIKQAEEQNGTGAGTSLQT